METTKYGQVFYEAEAYEMFPRRQIPKWSRKIPREYRAIAAFFCALP